MNKLEKLLKSKSKLKYKKGGLLDHNPRVGTQVDPNKKKTAKEKTADRILAEKIAAEKNINIKLLDDFRDSVMYAESKGNYKAIQKPREGYTSAPGRGAFQFETDTDGGSGSARTAINRLKFLTKHYKMDVPQDILDLEKTGSSDVSRLSPSSQNMLHDANFYRGKHGDYEALKRNDFRTPYVKHHYAGPEAEHEKKGDWFDSQMKSRAKSKEKLGLGGDLLEGAASGGGAGLLSAGLNAALPGAGTAIQMGTALVGGVMSGIDELKANDIKLKKNTNPYGIMKDGGSLESQGMKNYVGPSHKGGGIPINTDGSIGPNGPEVEGKEKAYSFKHVNQGNNYVFPKKMKGMIEAMGKKYKDNNFIDQATKEMSLNKLAKSNDKRKAREAAKAEATAMANQQMADPQMGKQEMRNGGKLLAGADPAEDPIKRSIIPTIPKINTLTSSKAPLNSMKLIETRGSKDAKEILAKKANELTGEELANENFKKLANQRAIYQGLTGLAANSPTKRRYNPNEAEVERLTDSSLRVTKETDNKILGQDYATKNTIRSSNRGTGSVNANLANITAGTQQTLANLGVTNDGIMAGRKAQAANVKNILGTQRAAEDIRADLTDDQNKAALANRGTQGIDDKIEMEKFLNNRDVTAREFDANMKMLESRYSSNVSDVYDTMRNGETKEIRDAARLKFEFMINEEGKKK